MSSILDKFKANGTLVLDLDFSKKSLLDQSGNGNTCVPSAGTAWVTSKKQAGIKCAANQTHFITVPDAPELRSTEGTFIICTDGFRSQYINQTFFDHEAGTG